MGKMVLKYLLARLREPSTYAGLAAVAAGLGHAGGAELINHVGGWLIPVLGAAAVMIPGEGKQDPAAPPEIRADSGQ